MDTSIKLKKFENYTQTLVKVNAYTLADNKEGSTVVDEVMKLVKKYAKKKGLEVC